MVPTDPTAAIVLVTGAPGPTVGTARMVKVVGSSPAVFGTSKTTVADPTPAVALVIVGTPGGATASVPSANFSCSTLVRVSTPSLAVSGATTGPVCVTISWPGLLPAVTV